MKQPPARTVRLDGARHPIAIAAERTALSQDLLRVWERRYAAVEPTRDEAGQRLYTDADIERLSLLHSATRAGRSIGQIARLPIDDLQRLVDEDAAARATRPTEARAFETTPVVDAALVLARSLESAQLDAHLRRAAAVLGATAFMDSVAAPLLRRIGDEWHAGRLSPAQEHLASSVAHDIIVGMMREFGPAKGAPRVLVATPAGDRHAIGAALVGAAAAIEGWDVVYLGADLPASDIAAAAIAARVGVVALSIIYVDDRDRLLGEVSVLRALLPAYISILAGGSGAALLAPELSANGVHLVSKVSQLPHALRNHGNAS